jgi:PQQ-dependent catabolism-associated CXXCW motif protein
MFPDGRADAVREMPGTIRLCLLLLAPLFLSAATLPESRGYRLVADDNTTPDRIAGGTVIHTEALNTLIKGEPVTVIDVAVAPKRPPGMTSATPWMPLPHSVIPGSTWLPELGEDDAASPLDNWLRNRLTALTGGDIDHPLVLYCHPQCRRSWNAATRAIAYGYRRVYWYPDGIEGWQSAGLPTTVAIAQEFPQS